MKKIIWRFDDLNFSEKMEGEDASLWKLKEVVYAFLQNNQKANFGLITRYQNKTFKDNPNYYHCLKRLGSLGCKIMCHGVYHENFRKIENPRNRIKLMKQDFIKMGFAPDAVVFPYVSVPYSLIPFLKAEDFRIIFRAKGRNFFTQKTNKAFDMLSQALFNITILYDDVSTAVSYHPPRLKSFSKIKEEIASVNKNTVLVMDHYWLYTKNEIKSLNEFIKHSKNNYKYVSL
jgi:hypothetical protein